MGVPKRGLRLVTPVSKLTGDPHTAQDDRQKRFELRSNPVGAAGFSPLING
jgi:hypothetical protein